MAITAHKTISRTCPTMGKVTLVTQGMISRIMATMAEAQAAAKVAGLPIPVEKREYTIAELFNQGKKAQVRTIGFGARH